MIKWLNQLLLPVVTIAVLMCSGAQIPQDQMIESEPVTDGMNIDYDKDEFERQTTEIRTKYDKCVVYQDGLLSWSEENEPADCDEIVISQLKQNMDFMNALASGSEGTVTILEDRTLFFDIPDVYEQQWQAWQLKWNWWGWTYKLDSDFGKMIGIAGLAYRMYSYVSGGINFCKNILTITDKDKLTSGLTTIVFYLPGTGVSDLVCTYLQDYISIIASALVSLNLALMTLKTMSFGIGWVVSTLLNFIAGNMTPSLITSCSMIYNCFKYNSPIYCQIRWFGTINYSLNPF